MYVCIECKFIQGHPLQYCPGCGRPLVKLDFTSTEYAALRQQGWRLEGDKNLYEYFIDGKPVELIDNNPYKTLLPYILSKYAFLSSFDQSKFHISFLENSRQATLYYGKTSDGDDYVIYFNTPKLYWRLKGSNLNIGDKDIKVETRNKILEQLNGGIA